MEKGVVGELDHVMEARVRLQRAGGQVPTFREVVEEFCKGSAIFSFSLEWGGSATRDGKQTFLFGKTPVYLDANVVFALKEGSEWRPVFTGGSCRSTVENRHRDAVEIPLASCKS